MRKKILLLTIVTLLLSVYVYNSRPGYVGRFIWKQTYGDVVPGKEMIYLSESTYQWPLVKDEKTKEYTGIVVFCLNERLIVYWFKEKSFFFYMYI